ncbi:MAG: NUDIX domain-containing protein [Nanoarchaeota archaeon]
MNDEPIALVDGQDRVIGETTRDKAHAKGLLHHEAFVYVFAKDQVLLQRRADSGLWDHSAAGHFPPKEDYLIGALRELKEELGISPPSLEELGKLLNEDWNMHSNSREKRFATVFLLRKEIPIASFILDPREIAEIRYFTKAELKTLMATDGIHESAKQAITQFILPLLS